MVRRLSAVLFILLFASLARAQSSSHLVTLTITDADTSVANPGTLTIYRVSGPCPSTLTGTGTILTSTLAITGSATFSDPNVVAGNSYCYYASVSIGGNTSSFSNTFLGTIQILAPTLSGTSK